MQNYLWTMKTQFDLILGPNTVKSSAHELIARDMTDLDGSVDIRHLLIQTLPSLEFHSQSCWRRRQFSSELFLVEDIAVSYRRHCPHATSSFTGVVVVFVVGLLASLLVVLV